MLKYQRLDDLVAAIGLPKCKLCTYCWDGVDNRQVDEPGLPFPEAAEAVSTPSSIEQKALTESRKTANTAKCPRNGGRPVPRQK